MRTRLGLMLGLMVAVLGLTFAQTLVLTNGDVNGDNQVDDADQLAVLFAQGQSCPQGCPEDLNGDGVVDDTDLLIVQFGMGAQGAPAFAGSVQAPSGSFSRPLTLRLGDWVGSARTVKVQLKPVGTESDASVPIYEWSVSVGGTDTQVSLENLPVGVYTVRAFPATAGRWLRTEGKLLTEVPWVFAVPTGATKVTVYWEPVSGATGYRVRWGTQSGNYPFSSPHLLAMSGMDVYRYTVEGLTSEVEYFFVVEAEYNGLWGPPSVEDSAVPHVGAIPWDSDNPDQILPAIRLAIRADWDEDISALSPDGWYYSETGWVRTRERAHIVSYETGEVMSASGAILAPIPQKERQHRCTDTGPYRRVKTRQGLDVVGAMGEIYLPPRRNPSANTYYFDLPQAMWNRYTAGSIENATRDTPHVYFGMEYTAKNGKRVDVEGMLALHPAGRGQINPSYDPNDPNSLPEIGRTPNSPPPNFDRWLLMLNVPKADSGEADSGGRRNYIAVTGDFESLSYGVNGQYAPYGFVVWMMLSLETGDTRNKFVSLHVHAWRYIHDDRFDTPSYKRTIVGCAYQREPLPYQQSSARIRRVISIAQRKEAVEQHGGWRRTGSFFSKCGVGYTPLFTPEDLTPIEVNIGSIGWRLWTSDVSEQPENCPPTGVITVEQPIQQWCREVVNINLRR